MLQRKSSIQSMHVVADALTMGIAKMDAAGQKMIRKNQAVAVINKQDAN